MTLKRFRNYPEETIDFDNPTFLVGRNGAGKSNLVDALPLLREAMAEPLTSVLDRRGGIQAVRNRPPRSGRAPNMGIGIHFADPNGAGGCARYAFELKAVKDFSFEVTREQCVVDLRDGTRHWFDRQGETFRSSVATLAPATEPTALALPIVGGDSRFRPVVRFLRNMCCYRIEPTRLRDLQDPDAGVQLRPDGGNAASVLKRMQDEHPEAVRRLLQLLETVVPTTESVSAQKRGNRIGLTFSQRWTSGRRLRFEAFSMSDGTLRIFGLLLAVFQRPAPSVLVIEEPEATIHPGALGTVLDLLRQASDESSVVVTTHSPDVLDAEWIRPRHLRLLQWRSGVAKVAPVSDGSAESMREHLMGAGELLRANCLNPSALFLAEPTRPSLFQAAGP